MKIKELKIKLRELLNSTFRSISTDKGIISWESDGELPEVEERVWSLDEEGNEIEVEDGDYTLENKTVIKVADNKVVEVVKVETSELDGEGGGEPSEPSEPEGGNDEPGNDEPGNDEPGNDEPGNDEPSNDEPGNEDTQGGDGQEGEGNDGQDGDETPAEPEGEGDGEEGAGSIDKDKRIKELEEEIARLLAKIEELNAQIEELEKRPLAKSAEEEFKSVNRIEKTGDKRIDRLIDIMSAK